MICLNPIENQVTRIIFLALDNSVYGNLAKLPVELQFIQFIFGCRFRGLDKWWEHIFYGSGGFLVIHQDAR
jgi:hypothetical protein